MKMNMAIANLLGARKPSGSPWLPVCALLACCACGGGAPGERDPDLDIVDVAYEDGSSGGEAWDAPLVVGDEVVSRADDGHDSRIDFLGDASRTMIKARTRGKMPQ